MAAGGAILAHVGLIALLLWGPAARRHVTHESIMMVRLLSPTPASLPQPKTPPPVHRPPTEHKARALPRVAREPPVVPSPAPQPIITVSTETPSIHPPAPPAVRPAPALKAPPPDYVALLAARLAAVKSYPESARAHRQQGTALLYFELDRNGTVLSWRIARSSGYGALDAEVAAMIVAASPFPPFPAALHGATESFLVPIEFSLQ